MQTEYFAFHTGNGEMWKPFSSMQNIEYFFGEPTTFTDQMANAFEIFNPQKNGVFSHLYAECEYAWMVKLVQRISWMHVSNVLQKYK